MGFSHKDDEIELLNGDGEYPLNACTCVISTAQLNEQVQKELEISDPTQEIAEAVLTAWTWPMIPPIKIIIP